MDGISLPAHNLVEANKRLLELQQWVRDERRSQKASKAPCRHKPPWDEDRGQDEAFRPYADLPEHLGWGSARVTAVLRRRQQEPTCVDGGQEWVRQSSDTAASGAKTTNNIQLAPASNQQSATDSSQASNWVKLYPDIGLGMLRQELAASGRLWLLLRYLDKDGSGVVRIDIIKKQLTNNSSALRLCGKRQLRNLLRDGEGLYWTRGKERVWLRSAAKVAYALGVERLTGRPVVLSVPALLAGIGTFRAHLYTAFHSGRMKDTPNGEQTMPIARETMEQLSGVGRSSQRTYEERVGVEVQANFAVGNLSTKENQENRAWIQGQALFELKDYRGQQGKKGKTYLAWQLPNTYIGQHRHRPRGRQKRINRELKGLVMKGMPGNVGATSETQKLEKVYYPNGKLAAKAYGRDPERELYWKSHRQGNGRLQIWQQIEGR